MSSLLAKFKALEAVGPPKKIVNLQTPDGDVIKVEVRAMTGEVKKACNASTVASDRKADNDFNKAMLVIYSVFDPETGEQVFSPDDADRVLRMPWYFDSLFVVASSLNNWMPDEGKVG
jgi:hypothetical protein